MTLRPARSWRQSALLLVLISALLWPQVTYATTLKSDSGRVSVSNIHRIDDDFYAFCQQLDIDGEIIGDLTSFSYRPIIRGTVSQSANLFGRFISHRGTIGGSMRAFGEEIEIDGAIDRSAILMGSNISLGQETMIQRDLHAFGNTIYIDGTIMEDVFIRGNTVTLAGQIEGNVDVAAQKIIVTSSATINGDLTYATKSDEGLTITSGADIRGEVLRREVTDDDEEESSVAKIAVGITWMLAAFLFGLVVVRLFRPYAEKSLTQARHHALGSFAAGLVGLIGLGLALVILVLAAVFILSGMAMLSSEASMVVGLLLVVFSTLALPLSAFVGVAGWVIFYSGRIVIAFLIGYYLRRLLGRSKVEPEPKKLFGALSLFSGLMVLLLLGSLPWVGTLIYLLTTITGAGAILMGIHSGRKNSLSASTE